MEDDDNASFISCILFCDEEPFDSTPPRPEQQQEQQQQEQDEQGGGEVLLLHVRTPDMDDDGDEVVEYYKAKERLYAPQRDGCYLRHLLLQVSSGRSPPTTSQPQPQHGVSAARFKAVSYIIHALSRLGLAAATAFNAVNYLDRFLSINCHLMWEEWMVEVVSVACLSVACKLDEVTIPSLHDLQMEEVMGHSFRPSTIRDMELTLLKALQWRLACVTPFSFLLLLPTVAASRCTTTALLLRSLFDPSFLRFDASLVAASALTCVAVAQHPQQLHLSTHINRLIHPLRQTDSEVKECFNMMKAIYTNLDVSSDNNNNPVLPELPAVSRRRRLFA
ncbi:hypothetical protein GUJ93_ZPchr0011g27303 [Zizania palustris]|uniref:Cyclin-like domain-containing protein n=1 Tax=Zizania palustris TaxID=103762 RepID=A0A8J5WL32_ZIZPA|nr:hypothetical protein GUJ93_ZPchr0011g27303 [Zizania palustris]